MESQRRRSSRMLTNLFVRFFRESVDNSLLRAQIGIAENCSADGMFISTGHLYSEGSVVTLEFELEPSVRPRKIVQARAIVRWVQRFVKHPGMGVEFVLFDDWGKHVFRDWLINVPPSQDNEECSGYA